MPVSRSRCGRSDRGLGILALKACGPLLAGGRVPPAPLRNAISLLTPALIASLVVTATLTRVQHLVVDARLGGARCRCGRACRPRTACRRATRCRRDRRQHQTPLQSKGAVARAVPFCAKSQQRRAELAGRRTTRGAAIRCFRQLIHRAAVMRRSTPAAGVSGNDVKAFDGTGSKATFAPIECCCRIFCAAVIPVVVVFDGAVARGRPNTSAAIAR